MRRLLIVVPGIMGSNLMYKAYKVWPRFFRKMLDRIRNTFL